jgi:hypothetical protein
MRRAALVPIASRLLVLALLTTATTRADALPSFARQTGQECAACHVGGNFPQLTAWGRWFKLTGYSSGKFVWTPSQGVNYVPAGLLAQVGVTWAGQPKDASGNAIVPYNGAVAVEQVSFAFGNKITDWAGFFYEAEASYGYPGYTWSVGPADFRAAYVFHPGNSELLLGFDMNNGPTQSDVWGTLPFWGFPYYTSPLGLGTPAAPQIASLSGLVGSVGLYAMLNRELYAEFALYTVGTGFFRWGSWGPNNFNTAGTPYLNGWAPYWRAYWTREWGPSTLMLGTVGMVSQVFPAVTPRTAPADTFTDVGFDAEYQWITERHKVTVGVTYIHEWQSWTGSQPLGLSAIQSGALNTLNANIAYNYANHWNLSVGYFLSNGSDNANLYGVSAPSGQTLSNSPNTSGYILEADYLVTQNIKLMLQYVGYFNFNGLTTNIDGQGRFASDNNTLWLNLFVVL